MTRKCKLSPEVFWWIGLSLSIFAFLLIYILVDSIKNIAIILSLLMLGSFAGLSIRALWKIYAGIKVYPMKRISSCQEVYYTKIKFYPGNGIGHYKIKRPGGRYRRLTKNEKILFRRARKGPKEKGPGDKDYLVMDYFFIPKKVPQIN